MRAADDTPSDPFADLLADEATHAWLDGPGRSNLAAGTSERVSAADVDAGEHPARETVTADAAEPPAPADLPPLARGALRRTPVLTAAQPRSARRRPDLAALASKPQKRARPRPTRPIPPADTLAELLAPTAPVNAGAALDPTRAAAQPAATRPAPHDLTPDVDPPAQGPGRSAAPLLRQLAIGTGLMTALVCGAAALAAATPRPASPAADLQPAVTADLARAVHRAGERIAARQRADARRAAERRAAERRAAERRAAERLRTEPARRSLTPSATSVRPSASAASQLHHPNPSPSLTCELGPC